MKQLLEKLTTLAAYTAAVCTIVILISRILQNMLRLSVRIHTADIFKLGIIHHNRI